MDAAQLGAIFLYFMMLSFLAIGGAPSVLTEMQRYVVDVHGWMSAAQFAELYTLAQIAPGPNIMYIPLVGWRIGGIAGAAATLLPFLVPSATLTLVVARLYARDPKAAFGAAIRRGLTPVTIGLVFASSWILARAVNHDWRAYLLTLVTVLVVVRTPVSPLWLLGLGAAAGVFGWV